MTRQTENRLGLAKVEVAQRVGSPVSLHDTVGIPPTKEQESISDLYEVKGGRYVLKLTQTPCWETRRTRNTSRHCSPDRPCRS